LCYKIIAIIIIIINLSQTGMHKKLEVPP